MPVVPTSPLPLALAPHTVESLRALHEARRPWIYWVALIGVLVGLMSLPLVQVDVAVSAPGIVRPATERIELRLPLSGRIARVLARDNERVALGQPLLEVATPDLDERLARNAALQTEKRAVLAWLDEFSTARRTEPSVLPELDVGRAVESFAGVRALQQEAAQLRVQIEASRVAEAKARTELARATALAEKGIATQRELDDARYALERVRAEARITVWHDHGEHRTRRFRSRHGENSAPLP